MAKRYIFGSICQVGYYNEFALGGIMKFQGKSRDLNLLPKKAQIPFLPNGSTCLFVDTSAKWIYNGSDDSWYLYENSGGGGGGEYEIAENQEV